MRWLSLYLRAQRIPTALLTMIASVAALGALAQLADNSVLGTRLAVLAVAVGVGAVAASLGSVDVELDRVAAVPWLPRRVGHVLALSVLVVGAVLITQQLGGQLVPNEVVLRDGVGLIGLAAFGAAVFGGQLAWCLPVAAAVVAVSATPSEDRTMQVLTWLVQQPQTSAATITALVLGIGGTATYALSGPRR